MRYEDLPDYLTIKELKQYLRVGNNRAYSLANTPGFPHLKFGNRKIFPKAEVRAWVQREVEHGRLPRRLRAV